MKRSSPMILLAAAVTLAGACGSSTTTPSPDVAAAAGTYVLQTIDGQPLPAIVDQTGNDTAEITQGTVVLDESLAFNDITELRITQGGVVTTETEAAAGIWTVNGNTVQLSPNDGSGFYTMTWDGQNQLTQLFNQRTLVYQK